MSMQQEELTFEKVWRMFQETDRKFQETQQESQRQWQRTGQELERLSHEISDLTGSWGKFVESMVQPALIHLFAERGIALEMTATRVERYHQGREMEIDVLGVNREYVIVVEVKTTLKVGDVDAHLQRLAEFKDYFSEYQDRKVVGVVAGMRIEEEADKYAYRRGLYVIAQSGEAVQILNDIAFAPRLW